MDLRSVYGANASVYWVYERWSASAPDATVTGKVNAATALAAGTPDFVHRVDTWSPDSVAADWDSWSDRTTWTAAAADVSRAGSAAQALAGPAQQFVVSPAAARLAALDPAQVADAVAAAVTDPLALTVEDVADRLAGGASLADLAAEAGVPDDALLERVRAALPDLGDDVLAAAVAERVARHAGPLDAATLQLPPMAGGPATQVLALTLDRTAALLRTTPDALMSTLSGGSSLADLARARGVSGGALLDAVRWDLPPQTPGWDDRIALAEQVAGDTTSVTETPPQPLAGQLFEVTAEAGTTSVTVSLDATAALLGTTTDELMAQLSAGATLNDLADGLGVAHEDLVDAVLTDLPARTDGWSDAAELAEQVAASAASVTVVPDAGDAAPAGAPEAGRRFVVDVGAGPEAVETGLGTTLALLGSSLPDLHALLDEGLSLDDVAQAAGVTHGDLLDALVTDLPGLPPGWDDVYAFAEQVAATRVSEAFGGAAPEEPGV